VFHAERVYIDWLHQGHIVDCIYLLGLLAEQGNRSMCLSVCLSVCLHIFTIDVKTSLPYRS